MQHHKVWNLILYDLPLAKSVVCKACGRWQMYWFKNKSHYCRRCGKPLEEP